MTEQDKKTFIEFLTKLVENNDGNSVMHIVQETYSEHPKAFVLARLAAVSQALTNSGMFDFCTKYRNEPIFRPKCFGCEQEVFEGTIHPELPTVALCSCCKSYISLGQKIENDKHRIVDSLKLVVSESKAQCGEYEEGCVRCHASEDVEQLIKAVECIKK